MPANRAEVTRRTRYVVSNAGIACFDRGSFGGYMPQGLIHAFPESICAVIVRPNLGCRASSETDCAIPQPNEWKLEPRVARRTFACFGCT